MKKQSIHQDLVDRMDAVRAGRTWKVVCAEAGVSPAHVSKVRWQHGSFGIELYLKIQEWVVAQEKAQSEVTAPDPEAASPSSC